MLTPGPDHPITIKPTQQRWRAYFNHHVIADSIDVLILKEADLPAVVYFPRADVGMEYMGRTQRQTHCPYKGDASYFTLTMSGQIAENVAWSYGDPAEAMTPIRERIAFYTDRVEVYPVDDAAVNPDHREASQDISQDMMDRAEIDEIIQHTDAGDGVSQREHWRPNVDVPGGEEGGVR